MRRSGRLAVPGIRSKEDLERNNEEERDSVCAPDQHLGRIGFVGLVVWWIHSEGRRTRQMLQDAPRHSTTGSEGFKKPDVRPVDVSGSTPIADGSISSERSSAEKHGTATKAVPAKPVVVAPRTEPVEDFELKDHDVFPGS